MEVGIILGQDAYEIQRPMDYKIGARSEPFAVLAELGWVVSGPWQARKVKMFVISPSQKMWQWQKISNHGGTYKLMLPK